MFPESCQQELYLFNLSITNQLWKFLFGYKLLEHIVAVGVLFPSLEKLTLASHSKIMLKED